MKCPYCNHQESKVIDKRETGDNEEITRRRRECLHCGKRFTTHEKVESFNLVVIKKSGNRQSFDRDKISKGMYKACEKRPISHEQIDQVVNEIEAEIRNKDTTEIPSKMIGEIIMKKLRRLDKVAYIRFASVYKDFEDVDTFKEEIEKLLRKRSKKD
ncbi:MAG: transcriptional regulator NrdR [archaeon]